MTPSDHASLLRRLVEGDESAATELYDDFAPRLHRAACGMLGSREDADDAVHDVFLSLVRSRFEILHVENLNAYLFTSLRRAARRIGSDRQRRTSMENALSFKSATEEIAGEKTDRLERALASLPAEQREVIALKIDGGLTFKEIGATLEIGANSAASRYRYALEKLRAILGEDR